MKPTDPTPEEYTKWIKENVCDDSWSEKTSNKVLRFILDELLLNDKSEINQYFLRLCLNKLT